jgi:hypothetical protein
MALLGALAASLAVAVASAAAAPPEYVGLQNVPSIQGPTEPDEFSWQVKLGEDEYLRLVSETEAQVVYEDGSTSATSLTILAQGAKDADGTTVPTSLRVSEEDVLTLVVHDREGAFVYPVTVPVPWVLVREITAIPPAIPLEPVKSEPNPWINPTHPAPAVQAADCTVPPLRGLAMSAAKSWLRAAGCSLGKVHLAPHSTRGKGKVVKQFRPAGTELPDGAPVALKLGG